MTKVFASPAALAAAVGTRLGTSEWIRVDQSRIDLFAEATGDHQWIHVDAERAASGPFGGTIAHGFLTLSLIPVLVKEVYRTEGVAMAVNYGLNKVRFMNPVRVGSRVRASVDVVAADEVRGGHQVVLKVTVEIEGADKPACVAETVTRLHT
ncbi:MaoC family dehydratase [Streptomyces sp. BBFR115]|uniref:MaoC family dehydratase n=1 Tax=Streptomyces sp. BBFR115 TaxID=3448173 RepID=UPI003F773500